VLELNPTTRAGLRLWLAATLAIAMTLWSGRQGTLPLAVMMVVLFVNENDLTPIGTAFRQLAGAIVGIIAGLVIVSFAAGWLMLSLGLLVAGLLCRVVGLGANVGMALLSCWAVIVLGQGKSFDAATLFNLALPAVLGLVAAQFATWVVWPRLRRQRLVELDRQLSQRFGQQRRDLHQWLQSGDGAPPPLLRSPEVLPSILQLQQLSSGTSSRSLTATQTRRWTQLGTLWRQVLTQWLVLEPQLQALPVPLPPQALQLLEQHFEHLDTAPIAGPPDLALTQWRQCGESAGAPPLLVLSLAMQLHQLLKLQHSQALLRRSLPADSAAGS
jgi:uncharacterized membrane protein YccC